MNLVYVHIGLQPLPEYTWDTIAQARRLYDGPIYLIAPLLAVDQDKAARYSVIHCHSEMLDDFGGNVEFKKVSFLDKANWKGFWETTLQRTFYLEAFMRRINGDPMIHCENDVIMFSDPKDVARKCDEHFGPAMVVMDGAEEHSSLAYTYISSVDRLNELNRLWIDYMLKGEEACKLEIGNECIVSEMVLLRVFRKKYPNLFETFPILPAGKGSENIDVFGGVFDPMSWGQWVCGVHQKPGKPYAVDFHWIGEKILDGTYDVEWTNCWGNRIPFVVDQETKRGVLLNCLHVHSKKISDWTWNNQ